MKAAIDIGTNTVLLLVAEEDTDPNLRVIYEDQRVPRLGKGVDQNRNLHPRSVSRVIEGIKEYQEILIKRFPEAGTPVVTATSAVRDANNRDEFVSKVFQETGLTVDILSGKEEAEYTYRGALSMLPGISGPIAVLDIGGGSTEVSVGEGNKLHDRFSYDMGCVRYTERYLAGNPPTEGQVEMCRASIRDGLNRRAFKLPENVTLTGVAGTVTSLAYMESGQTGAYNAAALNGKSLSQKQIQVWIDEIKARSSNWLLQQYPEVMEGRADIFLAGLLILEEFMTRYEIDKLLVSTGGIRYGALLGTFKS